MLKNSKALILGCSGKELTELEISFFKEQKPLGFILFARNIEAPEQVKKLVNNLRKSIGWHCPILIDQEGGRVARLRPPHWRKTPNMGLFAEIAKVNSDVAARGVYLNYRLIGQELFELGINVDCAPVCDILIEGAHDIVGDRSFGNNVETISKLAKSASDGLLDSGVLSIMKHIPGHGRAKSDSHKELPVVEDSISDLKNSDFKVFENLKNDIPWAMTAHILYKDIDLKKPATLSKKAIDLIRNDIGFDGVLISDDLSMHALKGSFADRTTQSQQAGCDVILHCNGDMTEMVEIAENTTILSGEALRRVEESLKSLENPDTVDSNLLQAQVDEILKAEKA